MALLHEHGVEPEIVEYLKTPPNPKTLADLIRMLDVEPHALLRVGEAPYRELGLNPQSSRADILRAIAAHPILLERPIVVLDDRAVIGRPPDRVLELLEQRAENRKA
jgi:arsenate reductase